MTSNGRRVTATPLTRRSSKSPRDARRPLLETNGYRPSYRLFEQAIVTTANAEETTVRLLTWWWSTIPSERLTGILDYPRMWRRPPTNHRTVAFDFGRPYKEFVNGDSTSVAWTQRRRVASAVAVVDRDEFHRLTTDARKPAGPSGDASRRRLAQPPTAIRSPSIRP